MTSDRPEEISFAGARLRHHRHVCAFFNGADEVYKILGPFIRDGFRCNHKAIHLVAPGHSDAHLERLRCDGIDTEVYQRTGQLEVRSTVDAYLPDGRFEQDRMVEVFTALASGNTDEPYSLSRIVCDMDWAADVDVDREELVEFESRINDLWSQHDDIVICIYDLTKFRADFVVDVLRTHPLALVGATLRENPFFIPPSEFLQERQTRNASTEEQSDAAE